MSSTSFSSDETTRVKYGSNDVTVEVLQSTPASNFTSKGGRSGVTPVSRRLLANDLVTLPPEATGYLATVVANPEALAAQVDARTGYLGTYRTADGDLRSARAHVYLGACLPLFNPRVGDQSVLRRPAPTTLLEDGVATAVQDYEMTSSQFENFVRDTVTRVASVGGQYAESILATGVSEPGLCEVASIHLNDMNVRFTTLVLRDGGTRCVQAVLARLGIGPSQSGRAADFLLERIFGETFPGVADPESPEADKDGVVDITQTVKANLGRAIHADEVALAVAVAQGDMQTEVTLRQTMTLPEEILIGWDATGGNQHDSLEPAISARVRSRHVNVQAWSAPAQNADVIDSVISHLDADDLLTDRFNRLLSADSPDTAAAALKEYGCAATAANAGLWRATVILQELLSPALFERTKSLLRSKTGRGQIRRQHFAGYLAPLLDTSWRSAKIANAKQAANAWARSGALTEEMWQKPWTVVFVDDIAELATRTDRNARLTLAALGGVALVADRFLTSVAIAGTAAGGTLTTPYRVGQISEVVELLAHPKNADGRRQLVAAAQAFRSDAVCSTPWSQMERTRNSEQAAKTKASGGPSIPWYQIENVVTKEPLDIIGLMRIADFDGSKTPEAPKPITLPTPVPISKEQAAAGLGRRLFNARDAFDGVLKEVLDFEADTVGHHVLELDQADDLADTVATWSAKAIDLKRAAKELRAQSEVFDELDDLFDDETDEEA